MSLTLLEALSARRCTGMSVTARSLARLVIALEPIAVLYPRHHLVLSWRSQVGSERDSIRQFGLPRFRMACPCGHASSIVLATRLAERVAASMPQLRLSA